MGGDVQRLVERVGELERRQLESQQEGAAFRRLLLEHALRQEDDVESLRRSLFDIRRSLVARMDGESDPVSGPEQSTFYESVYSAIEERLRGSPEVVTSLQRRHVGVIADVDVDAPVIDLGCGRGEFLELLTQAGIEAVGVDGNSLFVERCRVQGLEVKQDDLFRYLQAQPDRSARAITMLQVMEHLSFPHLLRTIGEAFRVLAPGGVLLGETPNVANLAVGGSTFWLDHTHVQPLHPALLEALASFFGFEPVRVETLNPPEVDWRLGPDAGDSEVSEAVLGLQSYVLSGQDALLVAYRPEID